MSPNSLARTASVLLLTSAAAASAPEPHASSHPAQAAAAAPPQGLILELDEGERRVRRPREAGLAGLPDPFILKVDRRNGGSPELVMGYEEIAPGGTIRPHRHLMADEIIFVHKGSGRVSLGDRQADVGTGGTIYIPRETRISLTNTGSEPLGIAFFFSAPGFEEMMRENSVLEGEPVTIITAEERAAIEARNRWHTRYDE